MELPFPAPIRLPSRYEDLDLAFRGRLRPVPDLIGLVQRAWSAMGVSGGIRFLPIYGKSGSGKTCAAKELGTHLPDCHVFDLPRSAITSHDELTNLLVSRWQRRDSPKLAIPIVDQYEEAVAERDAIPTQFVELLSLLDRGELRDRPTLVLWLTTSEAFQRQLAAATSRNARILVMPNFELMGPPRTDWADIVEETFEFHNSGRSLADFDILHSDVEAAADTHDTLGQTIEAIGGELSNHTEPLQDISQYQVLMLWPVTDGLRITRVASFTNARDGYKLDWNAFYRQLNPEDQKQLPLRAFNRARLYFDFRLIPIAAADLHPLSRNLDSDEVELAPSYLSRFSKSHFFTILTENWNSAAYSPMRERESRRANEAREWYLAATRRPVLLSRRIAACLRAIGMTAFAEKQVKSPHSSFRSDILVERPGSLQRYALVELKVFAPEHTRPSSIRDAVQGTLRKYAHFGGFLQRQ